MTEREKILAQLCGFSEKDFERKQNEDSNETEVSIEERISAIEDAIIDIAQNVFGGNEE